MDHFLDFLNQNLWVLSTLFWNLLNSILDKPKEKYMLKVWLSKQWYYDWSWLIAVLGIVKTRIVEYITAEN